ncbi:MAG: hypothetical protein JF622_16550, partial [Terrabacter sp.]|nr:hypothetical protein [Terrabacter sp.]
NAIFSDTFNSNSLSSWSARNGAVSTSLVAGIPSGTYGMVAAGSVTPAYVTDNTPSAETTYRAQFSFNANTLSSGSGTTTWLTAFEGRSATGQSFAVQYHRVGAGAVTLRTVMNRAAFGATTSPALSLATGAHTIRVDWVQGTGGSLTLRVDGTQRDQRLGNNTGTALQIETARLGVIAGTTSTTAGTAWFDSFVSTRNSIP